MARVLADILRAYREFTTESDSPEVFHLWIALGTIAGAAQRKIFMQAAYFYVHTNMYIILTSPPGRAKKGAALNTGKSFLREVQPTVNFASESGSFEGIVAAMSKISGINPAHQSLTLYSMELGSLMATNPNGMVDFLTDIFDGNMDWTRQTVSHQTQTIKRPWLNIMAGTTPKWLGEKIGLIALEGGLTARCIFPYSEERLLENPWPELTGERKDLFDAIVNDLGHIATLEGRFDFADGKTGEAYKWYDSWYRDKPSDEYKYYHGEYKSRFPKLDDPRTASYFDRKHIHLLKVAMALSLSYKDELVLTIEDLQRAMNLLSATEPGMKKALTAVGKNEWATDAIRVLTQIKAKGKVKYAELLIANYHNLGKKKLDEILEELRTSGRIRQNGNEWVYVERTVNEEEA